MTTHLDLLTKGGRHRAIAVIEPAGKVTLWSIEDAKIKLDAWRADYNTTRPHSGLGNLAPAAFPTAAVQPETDNENALRTAKS